MVVAGGEPTPPAPAVPATPAQGGSGSNLVTQMVDGWKAAVSNGPDALAQALGLWFAAKAALQTVAAGVAGAVSQATINAANAKYQSMPLSPSVLATAIVRNVLPDSTSQQPAPPAGYPAAEYPGGGGIGSATAEAALSGLDGDRFAVMVGATGMSYGVIDALRLLNRYTNLWALDVENPAGTLPVYAGGTDLGHTYGIDIDEFGEVVAHSDIRPEYIPDLLKLARNSISPADAVEMVVKEKISLEVGQNLYAAAGGIPDQFPALVDAAGDSAGPEKIIDMLAHNLISTADARQGLGMSRINPFYYPLYITAAGGPGPVHSKWLSPFEIKSILDANPTLANEAVAWLEADGYDTEQATAWVTALSAGTVAAPKAESMSVILEEYQANIITEAEATAALTSLGYAAGAIGYLLQYATARATIAARNTAMARVRAAFLVGDITSAQVTTDLSQLGIPQAAIMTYLADWYVEAGTPHLHLSAAQVGKLLEDGVLTLEQALTKWVAMGYSPTDAELLLSIYPPPNPNATAP